MYKDIVSQTEESTLNHWNETFLKPMPFMAFSFTTSLYSCLSEQVQAVFGISTSLTWLLWLSCLAVSCWCQYETLAYCPPTWSFCIGRNANSFFATRCSCWSGKIVSPLTLYTTQLTNTAYQALQAWWNENETNRTDHHRLASRKGGIWKNESLRKINAYYKTMKVFFELICMAIWLPKPKYEPFITHNRGTSKHYFQWRINAEKAWTYLFKYTFVGVSLSD